MITYHLPRFLILFSQIGTKFVLWQKQSIPIKQTFKSPFNCTIDNIEVQQHSFYPWKNWFKSGIDSFWTELLERCWYTAIANIAKVMLHTLLCMSSIKTPSTLWIILSNLLRDVFQESVYKEFLHIHIASRITWLNHARHHIVIPFSGSIDFKSQNIPMPIYSRTLVIRWLGFCLVPTIVWRSMQTL